MNKSLTVILPLHHIKIPPGRISHHMQTGVDCKVSNTRMFQGQSFEGGTFESQLVRWSVKIVRELPSFSLLKEEEDNFFHNLVVYLSESHICQ